MIQKSDILTLELDKVLKMLSDACALFDAKAAALELEPQTDLHKVERLLQETDDAYKLTAAFGSPSFGNCRNVDNALAKAESGGVLSMTELLNVGEVLRTIRSLYEWRSHCENIDSDAISPYFEALIPNRYFEDKIFMSIRSEDEMDDNASAELKNIRRKIRSAELNIRDRLEKMTRSSTVQKYLQDAIVTQRDGRFVVPVKAEFKSEVPGLLHDTSSSGATLFIEPMAIVEVNNEIRALLIKEKDEIDRILAEMSGEVAAFAPNIRGSYQSAVSLSVIFGKASLAFSMKAARPKLNDEGRVYLKNARHPLLSKKTVVPVTIPLGKEYDTLIITGPNTGGKTVTIKTIGLLSLMAMCGMMLPVSDGSTVSVFHNILADIGDEQSIEQSLSTFSSHMVKIISILEKADSRSLVLIDELGAGTDPVEGAALATAILMKLRQKKAIIASTTHYAELKTFALETEGVCNASCEFDVESLRPTYKLILGIPGRSNAFAISEKLGLGTDVVGLAKSLVKEEDTRFERVVAILEEEVKKAEVARRDADRLKGEVEALKKSLKQQDDELRQKRDKAMETAREQAMAVVDKARVEAERLLSELEAIKKAKDTDEERIRKARAAVKGSISKMQEAADPVDSISDEDYKLPRPLKKGDRVFVRDLKKEAVVEADPVSDQVQILIGVIKTRVPLKSLRLVENKKAEPAKHRTIKKAVNSEGNIRSAQSEIDIRGINGDEAAMELDRFIDNSVMAGLNTVWIIHGKGTGALKKAVHVYLKSNRSVANFRLGLYGEGEDGVTIVTLK